MRRRPRVIGGVPFADKSIVANDEQRFGAAAREAILKLRKPLRREAFILWLTRLPLESESLMK
jgi:hypothetical protein